MQAASLLCLPSHNEGVPNVVLEAMACGLPVVASRVGGIPEILPGHAGRLVPPHDRAALAQALDEALRADWSTASIAAHAARFDWQDNIAHLDRILTDAARIPEPVRP
jgi:glycosyltransferase involved in cell wall biosynthesis